MKLKAARLEQELQISCIGAVERLGEEEARMGGRGYGGGSVVGVGVFIPGRKAAFCLRSCEWLLAQLRSCLEGRPHGDGLGGRQLCAILRSSAGHL